MNRQPMFQLIRSLLGRGAKRHEIELIDRAIDRAAGGPNMGESIRRGDTMGQLGQSPTAQANPPHIQTHQLKLPDIKAPHIKAVGPAGLALIKKFEGCARIRDDGMVAAYPDPATGGAPWTIGWGSTGPGIGPDTIWSMEQCQARLEMDLQKYAAEVAAAIGDAPTSQAQFDAMVSFHYNTGAIARATLTRKHIAGDFAGARREFARWNRAAGRILRGLSRRREAEARLYAAHDPLI